MKRIVSTILCVMLMLTAFTGCTPKIQGIQDLSANIQPQTVQSGSDEWKNTDVYVPTDFALRLFRACAKPGENTLISPVSVLYALAMTANGARGETLSQMEDMMGMETGEWNAYLGGYLRNLPQSDKYEVELANSIWMRDDEKFKAEENFLQTNADVYNAGIYQAPFDETTLKDINEWTKNHTNDKIDEILESLPEEAVMVLVNALSFDAEWENVYKDYQFWDGVFTRNDGKKQDIKLMFSEEDSYLKDDQAKGFIKYYKDRKYAFAALLPDKGVSVDEYAASLTGEKLAAMLASPQEKKVRAAIPGFECEYSTELIDALNSMGMTYAFERDLADFSGIGQSPDGNLFISRVVHKTAITVGGMGTQAAAVTAELLEAGAEEPDEEPEEILLDRPFLYMIIDCEENLPLFIGVMKDMG